MNKYSFHMLHLYFCYFETASSFLFIIYAKSLICIKITNLLLHFSNLSYTIQVILAIIIVNVLGIFGYFLLALLVIMFYIFTKSSMDD